MTKYKIGRLDRRITFISIDKPIENEFGEIELKPVEKMTVWAFVEELKGKEKLELEKVDATVDYKIICRYNPEINQTMEIDYEGRRLEILSVTEISRRRYTEILAVENRSKDDRHKIV